MNKRVLVGLRASELARCPRQCALRAWHQPDGSVPRGRHLVRGQVFGLIVYEQFKRKYGNAAVGRELPIPWGDGWIGHADIVVWSERLIVEVVSSVSPQPVITAKIRQAQQYLHFAQQAKLPFSKAAVYVINPMDLDRELLYDAVLTKDVRAAIDADVEAVRAALAGGPLPPCRAETPRECREQLYCPFTEIAWEGWEPPEAIDLTDNVEAVALAENLALLHRRRRERQAEDELDKQEEEETRAELLALGVEPGQDYRLGPVELRVTAVAGRQTFSLSRARESGLWTPMDDERFESCLHLGQPSQRWTVRSTAEAELVEEEVPF